ncbi:unnamed protein product [Pelagomonas calceolata]|uniref:Uncharacterized protein n=1 Tax=Pelagomonas calceolata TaxID=35677 RepID=A0A8J2SMW3_9STRA|nr:unnamed protein product [Pelagomonas calceolata]
MFRARRVQSLESVVVFLPHRHAVVPLTPSTRHAIDATHFEEASLLARVEREAHARRFVAQREEVPPVERLRQLLVRRAAEAELALPGHLAVGREAPLRDAQDGGAFCFYRPAVFRCVLFCYCFAGC